MLMPTRNQQLLIALGIAAAIVIGAVVGMPKVLVGLVALLIIAAVATVAVVAYDWLNK